MKLRIYLDLDETLVWTARSSYHPALVNLPDRRIVGEYTTFLRPGVKELIHACQAVGETAIFTSGEEKFQTAVLAAHYITGIKVYGADTKQLPEADHQILVEDLDINCMGAQDKLHKLLARESIDHWGRIEEPLPKSISYIKVKPWGLPNRPDQELGFAAQKIQAIARELQKSAIPEIS